MDKIDKWKEEFKQIVVSRGYYGKSELIEKPNGLGFLNHSIDTMWSGFCLSKRVQPVVELPKPEMCFGKRPFAYVKLEHLTECLKSSGIQYRIKGE